MDLVLCEVAQRLKHLQAAVTAVPSVVLHLLAVFWPLLAVYGFSILSLVFKFTAGV